MQTKSVRQSNVALPNSDTPILPASPLYRRGSVIISNYGTKDAFLTKAGTAEVGKGVWIKAGTVDWYSFRDWHGAIRGICSDAAGTTVSIEQNFIDHILTEAEVDLESFSSSSSSSVSSSSSGS